MRMSILWVRGLIRLAPFRLFGTAAGVALAVALVSSLGLFLAYSSVSMTQRAVAAVPVDWQVEVIPSADPKPIADAIRKAVPISALHRVFYANTAGFVAQTGTTTQTTGPGQAIAFDQGYRSAFPREFRLLTGTLDGPLLFQQTAANLHARPGDTVTIRRVGLDSVQVSIAGVVDLPNADSLFQAVGLPPSAAPQAPPDNVIVLPLGQWHRLFDPQSSIRPASTQLQYHVRLDRKAIPANPLRAYTFVTRAARNLEARTAGKVLIGDNLAARLDAVRGDALYAKVLFLFLGLPGVMLAAALTVAVTSSHLAQRKVEQALLRVRGASGRRVMAMSIGEALIVAAAGIALGLGLTALLSIFGTFGQTVRFPGLAIPLTSIALGVALSALCVLLPVWMANCGGSTASSRTDTIRKERFRWLRFYPDAILLLASGLFFWQSASTSYQVVLAPEGVAATAVDYKAFIAPALFWVGLVILIIRLAEIAVTHHRHVLSHLVKPIAGAMTPAVTATLTHQSQRIAIGVMMLSLAVSFAVSTAIFNTTYNAQARVDAELTNGSDVTVFGTMAQPAGKYLQSLAALPHAATAEPMMHRFAYVGTDLQDMYGINPRTLGRATSLSNAYFAGGSASTILNRLAKTPNGVLVSEETVRDFQLNLGDTLNLRLMDARDHQYHPVAFKFVGVVREFPTAPKDSFLVANAAYVADKTHSNSAQYVLMKADGDPTGLAREASDLLASHPGLKVKDIKGVAHLIGSSLTAIDLKGLTRIELAFAVATAVAASGLLLILGFFERKRTFAILKALGAKPRQMASFIWSEGLFVLVSGTTFGFLAGVIIAGMLVKLLTGVFDPPPETLSYPAAYLGLLFAAITACTLGALWAAVRTSVKASADLLRDTVRV